jgi:hypothetical protein
MYRTSAILKWGKEVIGERISFCVCKQGAEERGRGGAVCFWVWKLCVLCA